MQPLLILANASFKKQLCCCTKNKDRLIFLYYGGVSEWLKEHAWKACVR